MGQPKDEQPAPEMRCNATAHDDCDPNDDVRAPGCSSSSRRQLAISVGESHTQRVRVVSSQKHLTQSQAWRARCNARQTDARSGTNLQSKGKARATRSRAAATTKKRKGNSLFTNGELSRTRGCELGSSLRNSRAPRPGLSDLAQREPGRGGRKGQCSRWARAELRAPS